METQVLELLKKPVCMMTGSEFFELTKYAHHVDISNAPVRITGIHALAEYLECSDSTIYALKRNGVLDAAVLSHVGKRIVFDGETARTLAAEYQKGQRITNK